MFLDYVKVSETQESLWQKIVSNTVGIRPSDAPASDHAFPNQVCDNCNPQSTDPERWKCWDTTPEALSETVSSLGNVALAPRYATSFASGVEMLIGTLDQTPETPAFATVQLVNHWVLITGYRRDDFASTTFPIMSVGGYNLNGLYIRDPQQTETVDHFSLVPIRTWQTDFGLVQCGDHIDTRPVVIGVRRLAAWVPFVAAFTGGVFLYAIWKWWWSRR
jgi:hypothetical protein